jgi:hypothetical protein
MMMHGLANIKNEIKVGKKKHYLGTACRQNSKHQQQTHSK